MIGLLTGGLAIARKSPFATLFGIGCLALMVTGVFLQIQVVSLKADLRVTEAKLETSRVIAEAQEQRAEAAERRAEEVLTDSRKREEETNAKVAKWERATADRTRELRLCYASGEAGPGPLSSGEGGAGGGEAGGSGEVVHRGVGPDLTALAARAERFRQALKRCYEVGDGQVR
ncbi:MAG: hypothetical protein SFV24_19040 [Gemmatimonadales bacterium]|nr:hypothetical protein [Gemmatimonadales bacterium]